MTFYFWFTYIWPRIKRNTYLIQLSQMTHATLRLREFKALLRMNDYKGDRWGSSMGAFFDLCSHVFELGDTPIDWGFRVGAAGNTVDGESIYYEFMSGLSYDELIEIGEFLFRLTNMLKLTEYAY